VIFVVFQCDALGAEVHEDLAHLADLELDDRAVEAVGGDEQVCEWVLPVDHAISQLRPLVDGVPFKRAVRGAGTDHRHDPQLTKLLHLSHGQSSGTDDANPFLDLAGCIEEDSPPAWAARGLARNTRVCQFRHPLGFRNHVREAHLEAAPIFGQHADPLRALARSVRHVHKGRSLLETTFLRSFTLVGEVHNPLPIKDEEAPVPARDQVALLLGPLPHRSDGNCAHRQCAMKRLRQRARKTCGKHEVREARGKLRKSTRA